MARHLCLPMFVASVNICSVCVHCSFQDVASQRSGSNNSQCKTQVGQLKHAPIALISSAVEHKGPDVAQHRLAQTSYMLEKRWSVPLWSFPPSKTLNAKCHMSSMFDLVYSVLALAHMLKYIYIYLHTYTYIELYYAALHCSIEHEMVLYYIAQITYSIIC